MAYTSKFLDAITSEKTKNTTKTTSTPTSNVSYSSDFTKTIEQMKNGTYTSKATSKTTEVAKTTKTAEKDINNESVDNLYSLKDYLSKQLKKVSATEESYTKLKTDYDTVISTIKTKESNGEKKSSLAKTSLNAAVQFSKGVAVSSVEKINDAILQLISSDNPITQAATADEGKKVEAVAKSYLKNTLDTSAIAFASSNPVISMLLKYASSKVTTPKNTNLEALQQSAADVIAEDQTTELLNKIGYGDKLSTGKTVQETLDENSKVTSTNTAGQVIQSIGENVTTAFLGAEAAALAGNASIVAKEIVSDLPFAMSSYGGSVEEAYKNGADRKTANKYAILNTALELATEKIYTAAGSVLRTNGAIDDAAIKKLTSKMTNEIYAKITKWSIGTLAEAGEEAVGWAVQPFIQKITIMKDKDLLTLWKSDELLTAVIGGALGGAFLGGADIAVSKEMLTDSKQKLEKIIKTSSNEEEVKIATDSLDEINESLDEKQALSDADEGAKKQITDASLNLESTLSDTNAETSTKISAIDTQIQSVIDYMTQFAPVGTVNIDESYAQLSELRQKRNELVNSAPEQDKTNIAESIISEIKDMSTTDMQVNELTVDTITDKVSQLETIAQQVDDKKNIPVMTNKINTKLNEDDNMNTAQSIIDKLNSYIPDTQKRVEIVTELNPEQSQIQDLASIFGKQVVFTKNLKEAGVVTKQNEDFIFVDTNANTNLVFTKGKTDMLLYVTGHELFHSLQMTYPEVYNEFIEYVKNDVTQEQIVDFMKSYDSSDSQHLLERLKIDGTFDINKIKSDMKTYASQNEALLSISEEMVSNEFGAMLLDKEYMINVKQKNNTLFMKLIGSVKKLFNSITGSVYNTSLTQIQVQNIRTMFENTLSEIATEEQKKGNLFDTEDDYVYHIDYTNSSPESFAKYGIKPSKRGQGGPGVYMANTEWNTLYNVEDVSEGTMYRIKKDELINKYGRYTQQTQQGIEFDNSTGEVILPGKTNVAPELLEVRQDGKWKKVLPEPVKQTTKTEIPDKVYRGTDSRLTEGKKRTTKGATFYSTKQQVAKTYSPTGETKEENLKDKIKKPLIIDGKGAMFNNIEYNGTKMSTDAITNLAKKQGYDSVIFKNIIDQGGKSLSGFKKGEDRTSDVIATITTDEKETKTVQREFATETYSSSKMSLNDRYTYVVNTVSKYEKETNGLLKNKILDTAIAAYNNYKKDGGTKANATLDVAVKDRFTKQMKEMLNVKKLPNADIQDGETVTSKFYTNTALKSDLFDDIINVAQNNKELRSYLTTTHDADTARAIQKLQDKGAIAINEFYAKESLDSVDTQLAKFLMTYYKAKNDIQQQLSIYTKLRAQATKQGQFIESLKIFKELSPVATVQAIQNELDTIFDELKQTKDVTLKNWLNENTSKAQLSASEKEWLYQMAEKASKLDIESREYKKTYALINSFIATRVPKSIATKLKVIRRLSMLFNPKTMVKNFGGNAIVAPINMYGADVFGTILDKSLSKKTGIRTVGFMDAKAFGKGFVQGAREATEDRKLGINTSRANPFEKQQGRTFSDKNVAGRTMNWVDKWTNYGLEIGDRPFEEAYYNNSLANQMRLNNVTEATETMKQLAQEEAEKRTWKNNGKFAAFASNIRSTLNQFVRLTPNGLKTGPITGNQEYFGFGDLVMPFIMTPANLMVAIYDYSPAAVISIAKSAKEYITSVKTGKDIAVSQRALTDSFGKAAAGTLLYALAYVLAKGGHLTGGDDEDDDVKAFMKAMGFQAYSVKIGDTYVPFDWAQPLSSPFAIMAELERQSENNKNGLDKGNAANTAFSLIAEAFKIGGDRMYEQGFLQSLNSLLSAESPNEGLIDFAIDLPQSFIPTLFKQIADVIDGNVKATYDSNNIISTMFSKLVAKIPGAKSALPNKTNVLGQTTKVYGGANNLANVFLNPASISKNTAGEVGDEILDVYNHTGEKAIMPQVAVTYFDYDTDGDGTKERMTFNTTQQSKLQEIMGTITNDAVQELLNNDVYNSATYEDKATALISLTQYAKAKAIEQSGFVDGYEIKTGNASQINKYITNGLSTENAVMYDSLINQIQGLKDSEGETITGSENGQKAYTIMNMQVSDTQKDIMLKLISPTSKNPETSDSLSKLSTKQQYIDYYSVSRSDYTIMNKYSRDDYDTATTYFKLDGTQYTEFAGKLSELRSDYDANGDVIDGSKKSKVTTYINGLPISQIQKVYLYGVAGYSVKQWKNELFSYVNSLDATADEKYNIWKELGLE